jgi:hypothetical protein
MTYPTPDGGHVVIEWRIVRTLKVSRSTFYYWRQTGKTPRCMVLPNGEIRIRRVDLDEWLSGLEEVA